jgi:hypothetical protein
MQNDPQDSSSALVPLDRQLELANERTTQLSEKLSAAIAQRTNLVNAGQALVGAIEMQASALPDQVVRAAAKMHNLLEVVMPGVSLAPRSAEVINDEALHLKAMAEAVARQRKTDTEVEAMVKELPEELAGIANDLRTGFTTAGAQQEAISDAYERGKARGHAEGRQEGHGKGYESGETDGYARREVVEEELRTRAWNAGYNARVEDQARDLAELSFLGLLRVRAECRRMVKALKGKVGDIDRTSARYWQNNADKRDVVGLATSSGFPEGVDVNFESKRGVTPIRESVGEYSIRDVESGRVIGDYHGMPIYADENMAGVRIETGLGAVNVKLDNEPSEQTADDRLRRDWSPDAGEPKEKLW